MRKEIIAAVITESVNKFLAAQDVRPGFTVKIEYPANPDFGDYATPIAMELAKQLKKPPLQIADGIAALCSHDIFESVQVAKPGFINMKLSKRAVSSGIRAILTDDTYGKNGEQDPKRILLEFVSANPTGPLHIGHGRWAAIGDTLARILRYAGNSVDCEFYVNNAGVQIENLRRSVAAVQQGAAIPEDGYHGAYIKELAARGGDPAEHMLSEHQELLARFGVPFDRFFSEKALRESGAVERVIQLLKEKGHVFEQEGALWFRSTAFGDDKDRVLKKSDGAYTYFAVDIAYHQEKISRAYEKLINVLGADHHGYVARLIAAVHVLSDGKTKIDVIIGQLVRLFRGKEVVRMSKRTGDMITLAEVIDEIGIDPARYFLLMRSAHTSLDFDLELAKKQDNENPVYYLQYAYARICNIFVQLKEKDLSYDPATVFDLEPITNPLTDALAKILLRFPDEVLEVSRTYEVHRMTQYLYDVASALHRFYYDNVVLDHTNDTTRAMRLTLVRAVQRVLFIGFDLIGIAKKESM
ncbi:MAG: arginine--tRNA ligase [Spirochaetes bacterium]|nr:arginine--tRNA ligase [Spirochaetota bacterium]